MIVRLSSRAKARLVGAPHDIRRGRDRVKARRTPNRSDTIVAFSGGEL
jgi:hypothetical protein